MSEQAGKAQIQKLISLEIFNAMYTMYFTKHDSTGKGWLRLTSDDHDMYM